MDKIFECEVRQWKPDPSTGKGAPLWVVMPVDKAIQLADVTIRCMKCHGPIRLHRAGPLGVPRAHAEHLRRHPGCPLGDCFDGTFRTSPTPIGS
ncbi:MAG: hypothetical protein DMG21_04570 [Acidobacteria bacterium]|nr:MAG: hypothetical protein DMG21_04570 [Acidobacteriota bacterium]